jgi:bifunctional DNA-binding transcriptional regulator/antitoxin component of YhaV-PrlF toxin-antitoxin module
MNMDIGTIVTPNIKGQVVIPWRIREQLGITTQTPFQVVVNGQGIMFYPVQGVVRKGELTSGVLTRILDETRGVWVKDRTYGKHQARRTRRELVASNKRRKAW